ncbi:MAG: cysteine--tRNA ligase, partial [Clostridia bacterium]|nr:cysteine--tRNA ligase [Clostridia bacterium]
GVRKFREALDNDINTSLAITALYDVFKLKTNDETKLSLIENFEKVLSLGLLSGAEKLRAEEKKEEVENVSVDSELLRYINEKIEARREAKLSKNYALADEIRGELLSRGITLIDTKEGTKFTVS